MGHAVDFTWHRKLLKAIFSWLLILMVAAKKKAVTLGSGFWFPAPIERLMK